MQTISVVAYCYGFRNPNIILYKVRKNCSDKNCRLGPTDNERSGLCVSFVG